MAVSKTTEYSAMRVAAIGAAGLIVGAGFTGIITHVDHAGDLDARMIELSVGILRSKPDPETIPLREWAIATIQARAKFHFSAEQIAALKNQQLPYTSGYDFSVGYDHGGYDGSPSSHLPMRSK